MLDERRRAPVQDTDVAVIGAGHGGLAMSRCLAEQSIDHVVLERGEIANAWRHERWNSMILLTPNWQSRLPGYAHDGPDEDGPRGRRFHLCLRGTSQRPGGDGSRSR